MSSDAENRVIAVGCSTLDGRACVAFTLNHGTTTLTANLTPTEARHYASLLLICADHMDAARDGAGGA